MTMDFHVQDLKLFISQGEWSEQNNSPFYEFVKNLQQTLRTFLMQMWPTSLLSFHYEYLILRPVYRCNIHLL